MGYSPQVLCQPLEVACATFGRKTRAVLIMDSDHIVLSAVQAETVADRIDKERNDNYDGKANS